MNIKLEWQIFRDTEKIMEIEYKTENKKSWKTAFFTTQKQKISKKIIFFKNILKVELN